MAKNTWICFTLTLSLSAHADPGLEALKKSMAPFVASATAGLDRAARLQTLEIPRGEALPKLACEDLKARIRKAYRVDPFEVAYENGSSFSYMCGGENGAAPTFLQKSWKGVTNFGMPVAYVVRLETPNLRYLETTDYLVDAQDRIVEIVEINRAAGGEIVVASVRSLDAQGNAYQNEVWGQVIQHRYTAIDGSNPWPAFRSIVHDERDSSKNVTTLIFTRADARDWESFELPLTHSWQGGFYLSGGKISRWPYAPTRQSQLLQKFRGGSELCATGHTRVNDAYQHFPEDSKAREACDKF